MVESERPFHKTGRTPVHSVSSPPENRIKTSAMTPNVWTRAGLSKYSPPTPSDPASMPITKKRVSDGIPNLTDNLIVRILRITNAENMMINSSIDVGMVCAGITLR